MGIEDLDTKQELGRWLGEYLEAEGLPMTAVQGLQEAITPGKFNLLTLENGWTNFGGTRTAGYMTVPGSGIGVYGVITSGATGTVFATLPAGARPQEQLQFPADNGQGSGALVITTTGACIAYTDEDPVEDFGFGVTFYPSVT